MSVRIALAASWLLIVAVMPLMSEAGTTGMLRGRVLLAETPAQDQLMQLQGATVFADSFTGERFAAMTDRSGFYAFVSLAPGDYWIYSAHPGYQRGCGWSVRIWADQILDLRPLVMFKQALIIDCIPPPRAKPDTAGGIYVFDSDGKPDY